MRALLRAELLAAKIPADIHQLDGAQRVASAPWPRRSVSRLAFECVFDRNHAGSGRLTPRGREIIADVGEQHGVDILEHACANEESLAAQKLLGNARPDDQSA